MCTSPDREVREQIFDFVKLWGNVRGERVVCQGHGQEVGAELLFFSITRKLLGVFCSNKVSGPGHVEGRPWQVERTKKRRNGNADFFSNFGKKTVFLCTKNAMGGWGSFAAVFGENFRKFVLSQLFVLDSSKCVAGLCEMRPGPGKLFCDDLWGVWKVVFVQSFFERVWGDCHCQRLFFVIEFSQRVFWFDASNKNTGPVRNVYMPWHKGERANFLILWSCEGMFVESALCGKVTDKKLA